MSALWMHWIIPLITVIIAMVLQKVIASKANANTKFIIPVLFFIVLIVYYLLGITLLAHTIIFIVIGEFFIVLQGFKSDRTHDETN
ncbi:hypothetical protein ACY2DA_02245 [Staphylococcus simulans]